MMTVNLPLMLMVGLCYLTFLKFVDTDLPGVLGVGALTLCFAHMAWITRPTERRIRRD